MQVPEQFHPFVRTSPFLSLVGPVYAARQQERLVIGLEIAEHHCNRRGTAHGGLLTTLADIVLGYTACHANIPGRQLTTASLTIDFLGPARIGVWVEGRAEVLKIGKGLAYANCLLSVRDVPIVRASGVFRVV